MSAKQKLIREAARSLGMVYGCTDHGCIWGHPGGMGTNGGCRCAADMPLGARVRLYSMARIASALAKQVEELSK